MIEVNNTTRDTSSAKCSTSQAKCRNIFNIIPSSAFVILSSLLTAILATGMRGEWILILVHIEKQFLTPEGHTVVNHSDASDFAQSLESRFFLFDNVHWYVLMSVAVSYLSLFTMAGYLKYTYYNKKRDKPDEWKCQPEKFLTPDNERHEMLMATVNMGIGGVISGIIACYILNGGYTSLYFSVSERGWFYLVFSTVFFYVVQDGVGYYAHRAYHIPWMYRRFHKWHHRYHQPTPYSATAMHPIEFITYQSIVALPLFVFPIYSGAFILILLYNYYYGVIDHSGIKMDAIWPWQPSSMFHDDHHRYFHCNFGFNLKLWDWMNDTLRRDDRIYGEHIFGGKGIKKIKQ